MLSKVSTLSINPIITNKEPSKYIQKIILLLTEKNKELGEISISLKTKTIELGLEIKENNRSISELDYALITLNDDLKEISSQESKSDIEDSILLLSKERNKLLRFVKVQKETLSTSQKDWDDKKSKFTGDLDKFFNSITEYIDLIKKTNENIEINLDEDVKSIISDQEFSSDSSEETDTLKLMDNELSSCSSDDEFCRKCGNLVCSCVD